MSNFNEETVVGTSMKNASLYPDKDYMVSKYDKNGRRGDELHTYTWQELDRNTKDICCALRNLGFKDFDRGAVFAPNRPRWVIATLSIIYLRGTMVPIYPTSKTEDVWWILEDSGAKFCFCGSSDHLERVLEVKDKLKNLQKIFVMDPEFDKSDDMVMGFNELLTLGKENRHLEPELEKIYSKADPEDMIALIYTSGTTGRPKGVMLTNTNVVSQRVVIGEMGFRQDDLWMSHLPMCHSYGFSTDILGASYVPGTMAILDSLDADEIRWGLQTFKPTVMNSVPRLWEKIYIQINTLIRERPAVTQNLFKKAINVGREVYTLENQKKPVPFSLKTKHALSQPLFAIVKKKAGLSRLRFCSTGGGPINPELIKFFGAMGVMLYQGYGLTETSPVINANTLSHNKLGTVGRPLDGVTIKIEEDGEILVKGPQVMKGYWNNPEANAEVFTEDGFFRTGDIGFVDDEGYLTITDRKKELLKTSGGKYVAPQPIENEFNTDTFIEQVTVVGDNRKYMTALIVPEFGALEDWADKQGISYHDDSELVKHPKVIELIEESVNNVNKKLAKYEQIKKYHIVDKPFTEEGGELTPTQKKKRKVIETKYKDFIDAMYPKEDIYNN